MPPELLISGVGHHGPRAGAGRAGQALGAADAVRGAGLDRRRGRWCWGWSSCNRTRRFGGVAGWLLLSLVYGLAAAGFYSQVRKVTEGNNGPISRIRGRDLGFSDREASAWS